MRIKRIIVLLVLPLVLGSCNQQKEEVAKVEQINCEQKDELLTEGATLIDVRADFEYEEGHLDEAINISVETIANKIESVVTDKEAKIIVYCRSGSRSATAAEALLNKGYTNVYDLGAMENCTN